jgi:hypothetical protein
MGDICVMSIKIVMECRHKLYDLIQSYENDPAKNLDPKDFLVLMKILYEFLIEEQIKSVEKK